MTINTKEAVIRNTSSILENNAESPPTAIAAQQKPLDSLAKVVLGNRIALDSLLAEQRGVCAVVNTTCCTWINTSRKAETQIT